MKRILCITLIAIVAMMARADIDKPIAFSQLPAKAQAFVQTHFPGNKVALSKVETEWLFHNSYCVIFTNGDKVQFDGRGNWIEVNCKHHVVPSAIIPVRIRNYVSQHYPSARVTKIEYALGKYEVFLDTGIELEFDKKFRLIDVD